MGKTTIQISKETLERLQDFKSFERESYEQVLNQLMNEVETEFLNEEEIKDIQESLEEIKQGKTKPIEVVAKELGVSLT